MEESVFPRSVLKHVNGKDFTVDTVGQSGAQVAGFIGLSHCGMTDRYQDIALCCRSLCHNPEEIARCPFDEDLFFHKLGAAGDAEKIRYYILLDKLF